METELACGWVWGLALGTDEMTSGASAEDDVIERRRLSESWTSVEADVAWSPDAGWAGLLAFDALGALADCFSKSRRGLGSDSSRI